jgi:sugar phosphate isomerase/epimerase
MQLGLCLAALSRHGIKQAAALASELGLTTVDLPTDRRLGLVADAVEPGSSEYAELAETLAANGLSVSTVSNSSECRMLLGPYGGYSDAGFSGTPAAARAKAIEVARRTISLAAALGAGHARLFLGCPDLNRWLTWNDGSSGWQRNVDKFAQRAAPLLRFAADHGVRLLIEPHPKQVAYDLPSLTALLTACDGQLDVCLDPANLLALGHDPVLLARTLPVLPAQMQAKDVEIAHGGTPRRGPGWVRYGPQPAIRFRSAGWGEVDWRSLLSALAERGFNGPVLIEHEDLLSSAADGVLSAREFLTPLLSVCAGHARSW